MTTTKTERTVSLSPESNDLIVKLAASLGIPEPAVMVMVVHTGLHALGSAVSVLQAQEDASAISAAASSMPSGSLN